MPYSLIFLQILQVYSYIDQLKIKVTQLEGEMQLKQDTPICKCDENAILEQTQLKIDQIRNNFEMLSHEVKQSITEVVQNASKMASEYDKSFKENSRLFLLQTEFLEFKHQFLVLLLGFKNVSQANDQGDFQKIG